MNRLVWAVILALASGVLGCKKAPTSAGSESTTPDKGGTQAGRDKGGTQPGQDKDQAAKAPEVTAREIENREAQGKQLVGQRRQMTCTFNAVGKPDWVKTNDLDDNHVSVLVLDSTNQL